jgi:hypothetical protein
VTALVGSEAAQQGWELDDLKWKQDAEVLCQLLSDMPMSLLQSPVLHKADLSYTGEPMKQISKQPITK